MSHIIGWLIEIQNLFRNESWNVMVSKDDFSWNKQLALISFKNKLTHQGLHLDLLNLLLKYRY